MRRPPSPPQVGEVAGQLWPGGRRRPLPRLLSPMIGLAAVAAPCPARAALTTVEVALPQIVAQQLPPAEAEATPRHKHSSLATVMLDGGLGHGTEFPGRVPDLTPRERSLLADLGWRRWGLGSWQTGSQQPGQTRGGAVTGLANATVSSATAAAERTLQQQRYSEPKPEMAPWHGTGERERAVQDLFKDKARQRSLREPRHILGVPKVLWALVLDVLAMLAFVSCIPFILTVAKRRRPQPAQVSS